MIAQCQARTGLEQLAELKVRMETLAAMVAECRQEAGAVTAVSPECRKEIGAEQLAELRERMESLIAMVADEWQKEQAPGGELATELKERLENRAAALRCELNELM